MSMTKIIAGRFQQQEQANAAIEELASAGFPAAQTTSFFVNPPGQHDQYPLGGDTAESAGSHDAPGGAAVGAVVGGAIGVAVGIATLPILGPTAAIAGAGVGAYTGSFVGALESLDDAAKPDPDGATKEGERKERPPRKSGMLVAVSVHESAQETAAKSILRAQGASDIEQAEGNITAGEWSDFDPLAAVMPIR